MPTVWIGLLGPLIVDTGNDTIQVKAGKMRSLFAALAVRAGDVVGLDSLAADVWDTTPPPTWRATLINYIRRLRLALGDADGRFLVTRQPGYMLLAGTDEIDLLVFESLCKAGTATAHAGDWQLASDTLGRADALWRGTPFADIPSQRIKDSYLTYLEAMRLNAISSRIDADMRLYPSRAAEVVPELRKLSREHPGDERFRELLMQALYQCGRTQEALGVLWDARRFSLEELGVGPGRRLHALYQRILDDDMERLPPLPP